MKKNLCFLLLTSLMCLTSCIRDIRVAYKAYIDDEYHLRAIQTFERNKSVCVDEYYYTSDVYSGHIEINITIPSEINGLPIRFLGRPRTTEISDVKYGSDKKIHNKGTVLEDRENSYNGFTIICYSYFEEGTTFDININCEAKLSERSAIKPFIFTLYHMFIEEKEVYTSEDEKELVFLIYNNNTYDLSKDVWQVFPCNFYITYNRKNKNLGYKHVTIYPNLIKRYEKPNN